MSLPGENLPKVEITPQGVQIPSEIVGVVQFVRDELLQAVDHLRSNDAPAQIVWTGDRSDPGGQFDRRVDKAILSTLQQVFRDHSGVSYGPDIADNTRTAVPITHAPDLVAIANQGLGAWAFGQCTAGPPPNDSILAVFPREDRDVAESVVELHRCVESWEEVKGKGHLPRVVQYIVAIHPPTSGDPGNI